MQLLTMVPEVVTLLYGQKNEGNENKIMLGDFNCAIDKNSLWMIGLRIYGEGRTLIPLISLGTIGPLPRIQDRLHLY